jgi:hypothetical protein
MPMGSGQYHANQKEKTIQKGQLSMDCRTLRSRTDDVPDDSDGHIFAKVFRI